MPLGWPAGLNPPGLPCRSQTPRAAPPDRVAAPRRSQHTMPCSVYTSGGSHAAWPCGSHHCHAPPGTHRCHAAWPWLAPHPSFPWLWPALLSVSPPAAPQSGSLPRHNRCLFELWPHPSAAPSHLGCGSAIGYIKQHLRELVNLGQGCRQASVRVRVRVRVRGAIRLGKDRHEAHGSASNTWLRGSASNTWLRGSASNTRLRGSASNTWLHGSASNTWLRGWDHSRCPHAQSPLTYPTPEPM